MTGVLKHEDRVTGSTTELRRFPQTLEALVSNVSLQQTLQKILRNAVWTTQPAWSVDDFSSTGNRASYV